MKTCLVTGGAGFIGSHLVEGLLAQDWTVRVLDDFSTGKPANLELWRNRIQIIEGSITRPDDIALAMRDCEVVFHLAALPSVTQSIEDPLTQHAITATGTVNVLNAARSFGVRRAVFAASASAYGDQPGDVRVESDPLIPLSPYAAAKLAGEHYCRSFTEVYGLETVRLRFFNVFGPRQDPKSPYTGVIAIFMAAMSAGKTPTIFGDGQQARDFVYVKNVVQAITLAGESTQANGQVYNIGMGAAITLLDLVRDLNHLLGTSLSPNHAPPRAGDIRHSQADIANARRDLKYNPEVPFLDGLRHTLAAYRQ